MMWRLLIDDKPAHWQMALDEAILLLRDRGFSPNTLRLYVFRPSAVTIGYFQKMSEAVNLEYIKQLDISVVRRITGGGAVYHDEKGEVTYSVIADLKSFPRDILESYKLICGGLVKSLEYLGLKASYMPINDVVVNGKKISGSAQIRRGKSLLQHGTLMYNTDLEILGKVLTAPRAKLENHRVKSITERVTTVSKELGVNVKKKEVLNAMINGFEEALNIKLVKGKLLEEEKRLASELAKKYESGEWTYKR